ncbi:MAG: hypothetical protein RJA52_1255 [Bacteroidota bacterium]
MTLLFSSFLLFGQQENVQAGWHLKEIISLPENQLVSLYLNHESKPTKIKLLLLNEELVGLAETELDLKRQGLDLKIEGVFFWNDKINLLTSLYYPGPKRNHLILDQFELSDLIKAESVLLDEAYTPGLYRIPFGYEISVDSTKMMFYSWSYPLPEDPAKISVTVFDKVQGKLWEQSLMLPFSNETMFLHGAKVNNQGKVFLFCENYEGRVSPEMVIVESQIRHYILELDQGYNSVKSFPLDAPSKVFLDITHKANENEVLYGMGFYRDKNKRFQEGIFFTTFDMKTSKLERYLLQITKATYDAAYNLGEKESAFSSQRLGFESYVPRDILFTKNGGIYLIAEQYKLPPYEFTSFQYNDIMVVKIDAQMKMEWVRRIAKRQIGFEELEEFYSFFSFVDGEDLYFLYNDNTSNDLKSGNIKALKSFEGKQGRSVLWQMDSKGRTLFRPMSGRLSSSGNSGLVLPGSCWKISDNELLVSAKKWSPSSRGSSKTLLKLNWKNL